MAEVFTEKLGMHYGRLIGLQGTDLDGGGIAAARNKGPTTTNLLQHVACIDEFHSRDRQQGTLLELVAPLDILPSDRVLVVGCGFGGTARFLASNYGCYVHGVDCNQEYVEAGEELNEVTGLRDKVKLCQGNVTDMSMLDWESFDVAYTEHVQMNIEDKEKFYSEIASKLAPGGKFLFHDVFLGTNRGKSPSYPTPWAETEDTSKLAPVEDIRRAMERAGFEIVRWEDRTETTAEFFETTSRTGHPPPFGPPPHQLLMGPNRKDKIQNHVANMKDRRTAVVMGAAFKCVV